MCLGTVGEIAAIGPDQWVEVRTGGRDITDSLPARRPRQHRTRRLLQAEDAYEDLVPVPHS